MISVSHGNTRFTGINCTTEYIDRDHDRPVTMIPVNIYVSLNHAAINGTQCNQGMPKRKTSWSGTSMHAHFQT